MSRQTTLDDYHDNRDHGRGNRDGGAYDMIQTDPDMPSPARVRWIDAFNKVCAQLNDVSAVFYL